MSNLWFTSKTGEFSLSEWKKIHSFFDEKRIPVNKIKPASFDYSDSQLGKYESTIEAKKDSIVEKEVAIEKDIEYQYRPTIKEGVIVGATSAAASGLTTFVSEIILTKKRTNKSVLEFGDEEWSRILGKTGLGTVSGAIRGVSMYTLSNVAHINTFIANGIITCSCGLAEFIHQKNKGNMSAEEFYNNLENIYLSGAVSALSSMLGQMFIPIPYLGAIIGNTIGSLIQKTMLGPLLGIKDPIIAKYLNDINRHKQQLNQKLQQFIDELQEEEDKFLTLLEKAFSPNCEEALKGSIQLASECGIADDELLKDIDEIDAYFKD